MRVLTFLNQKGGVGKTSSCFHLAGALARGGRRVLLIDNDPQASLTQGFVGPSSSLAIPAASSVAALYQPGADPMPEALVMATGFPGVWLVPGSIHLARFNKLPDDVWPDSQDGLRSFLRAVDTEFDLAMIDCPPNLHLCSWAALVASDTIVVPLQPEDFGSQGLAPVQESIEAVQAGPNPGLRLAGYLLTMVDRRLTVHLTYEAMLREMYGTAVFEAVFPRAKDYVEAVAARRPVGHYKPKAAAARAVVAIADELLRRAGLVDDAGRERGAA
jgi:chromosome partitioning protein